MTSSHCSLFPEVSPNQNLLDHVACRSEPGFESTCGYFDEPPLPGKIMEESSEATQCCTQMKTKMDSQLRLDANAKLCSMSETSMCRICHEGGSQEELLSPCECSGSLSSVHRSCLERWLSASGTSFCELCQFQFTVQRRSRSLLEWLQNQSLRQEKRTLLGDLVCFLLITPLASVSGWLCLRGAIDHLHFSSRLEAMGLIALTVALFTIYLFWTLVSLRYHCRLYNEWRVSNQRVIVLLPRPHSKISALHSLQSSLREKQLSKESIV
ncbi:E3 ubiquitin-protein ligase MARCH3-like [Xyrichtys novacula]|uniref:RING-type E3 ubiquitin transferase n=1 Tax=Xyrichtys novacula TaxID=13765 RepID=A0AAV1GBY9_XYRNO|nr:E3 ubiquitin-protein ligase MARCH3-like [Xyrichtys novacula]